MIPDDDHVSRYCSPGKIMSDGLPSAEGFRPPKDLRLSVNWLEFFHELDCAHALDRVRHALQETLTIKPNGRLAVLNVLAAKVAAAEASKTAGLGQPLSICIEHQPLPGNPSHAEIGYPSIAPMIVAAALQSLLQSEHMHPSIATDAA